MKSRPPFPRSISAWLVIVSGYLLGFIAACAPEVVSTPSSTPKPIQPVHSTESPRPTATIVAASTFDRLPIPSPTAPAIDGDAIASDTLALVTLTPAAAVIVATPTLPPASTPTLTPSPTSRPTDAFDSGSPLTTPTRFPSPSPELQALESEMVAAINAERAAHNLPPYQVDATLSVVARAHAQDMADRDYMSHITPEGKTYVDRLHEAGIEPRWRGENIALSVSPAEKAVEVTVAWWLDDAPHRRNILHPHHTQIGVGVAQTPDGWYVFVVDLMAVLKKEQ